MSAETGQKTASAEDTAPFAVPGVTWSPVSPRLVPLRRMLLLALGVPALALLCGVLGGLLSWETAAVAAVAGLALLTSVWFQIGRVVAAWGYSERAEDLLIRNGLLVRRLLVVPYGRMQFVDVSSGPLERWYGLASVRLHTAAITTNAFVPGLPPEEAARLRDRLASRGQAQAAGL